MVFSLLPVVKESESGNERDSDEEMSIPVQNLQEENDLEKLFGFKHNVENENSLYTDNSYESAHRMIPVVQNPDFSSRGSSNNQG